MRDRLCALFLAGKGALRFAHSRVPSKASPRRKETQILRQLRDVAKRTSIGRWDEQFDTTLLGCFK
jgi:hypothetical protein